MSHMHAEDQPLTTEYFAASRSRIESYISLFDTLDSPDDAAFMRDYLERIGIHLTLNGYSEPPGPVSPEEEAGLNNTLTVEHEVPEAVPASTPLRGRKALAVPPPLLGRFGLKGDH